MKTNHNIPTAGTIINRSTGDFYWVKLDNGQKILCYLTNRFRIPGRGGKGKKKPKIIMGDKVKVEIHPHDFSKGMLVGFVN